MLLCQEDALLAMYLNTVEVIKSYLWSLLQFQHFSYESEKMNFCKSCIIGGNLSFDAEIITTLSIKLLAQSVVGHGQNHEDIYMSTTSFFYFLFKVELNREKSRRMNHLEITRLLMKQEGVKQGEHRPIFLKLNKIPLSNLRLRNLTLKIIVKHI